MTITAGDQAAATEAAKKWVIADKKMQTFAAANRAFTEVITPLVKSGVSKEKRAQLIRVAVSASSEGFIDAVLLKQTEGFKNELAFAIPVIISHCAQDSMASKQERLNCMLRTSSLGDAEQAVLCTFFKKTWGIN